MERRNFFKKLGIVTGVAIVAPKLLTQKEEETEKVEFKSSNKPEIKDLGKHKFVFKIQNKKLIGVLEKYKLRNGTI